MLNATSSTELPVIRMNAHYLYEIGAQINPLNELAVGMSHLDALYPLLVAEGALEPLLNQSVYRLRTCRANGNELLAAIRRLRNKIEETPSETAANLNHGDIYYIKSAMGKFEAVLAAELQLTPLYLVIAKRGYDIDELVSRGESLFPEEISNKVPDAIVDIRQATKCLAFELPTACGFHLHRANESVLRRYYDAVTGGAPRPTSRNIGDYLVELKKLGKGDAKVTSALKDLKDLHRNPLIHPEHTLETTDEAVALLGGVLAVVTPMLKAIPENPPPAPAIPAQQLPGAVAIEKPKRKRTPKAS